MKDSEPAQVVTLDDIPGECALPELQSSEDDAQAVTKLGLQPTLPRTLNRLISLIGLNSSVVCPWPSYVFVSPLNLANGGTAGLVTGTLIACFLMAPVYMSLAEKISKYPTAGGQYHWVAALAPPSSRRFQSFFCCCILTFTWISYLTAATFLFGMDITAIVLIYTGEYHVKYTFAAAVCVQAISCAVNITWGKHMNLAETLVVLLHLVAFVLLIAVLGVATTTGLVTPSFTFTSETGWSPGFGVCLSTLYAVGVLSGFDCASHLAEDTVNARKRVPRSLLLSTTGNKILCIVCAILIVLCAGNVNELFGQPLGESGHPLGVIVQLIYNASRKNKALASAPFGLIAPIFMMCCINTTAAASRTVFAFIRDDRNPVVHKILARDLQRPERLPIITICFTAICPIFILWINFLSSVGFQAIVSQVTLSLSTTYIMAIGNSLYSRIYQPELLGRSFNGLFQLGTIWGCIIDTIAICFLTFIWILAWFPFTTPVNATTLNYAPIIDVGIAVLAILYYSLSARKHYQNPAPNEPGGIEL